MASDPVGKGVEDNREEGAYMLLKELIQMDKGTTKYSLIDATNTAGLSYGQVLMTCGKDYARVHYGSHQVVSFEATGKDKMTVHIR